MSQTDIIGRLYAALAAYEDVSPEQGAHPTFEDTIQTIVTIIAPIVPHHPESVMHRGANVFAALRRANADRQDAWCGEHKPDLAFRGLELAGEAGEVANAVKKLERERHGWPGSRVTVSDVAAELGDVVICADLIATQLGLQLDRCVIDKFNQTSVDRGYEIYIGDYTAPEMGLDAVRQRVVDRLKSDPAMRAALRPEQNGAVVTVKLEDLREWAKDFHAQNDDGIHDIVTPFDKYLYADARLRPMEANCGDLEFVETWEPVKNHPEYQYRPGAVSGELKYRTPGGVERDGFKSYEVLARAVELDDQNCRRWKGEDAARSDAKHEEVAREGRVPRKDVCSRDRDPPYNEPSSAPGRPNLVVFLNGDARSGKDTVAAMMAEQLEARGWKAEAVSSIEPVRAMLTLAGIDVTAKTEKDRFLLSEVGDRVEEHSNLRSDFCVETYIEGERAARQDGKPYALVLHTREPETIHKIAFKLRHENVETHTLFVAGRGTPISSNKADSKVRNMDYDMEVLNDASLEDLRGRVLHVVKALTA